MESCRRVFNYLEVDDTEVTFADRSSAQPHDVSLPLRTTSSKCICTLSLFYMMLMDSSFL